MTLHVYQQCKSEQLILGGECRILKLNQCLDALQLPLSRKKLIVLTYYRLVTINQLINVITISRERVENIQHDEHGVTNVSARRLPRNSDFRSKANQIDDIMGKYDIVCDRPRWFTSMFYNPGWVLVTSLCTRDKETDQWRKNETSTHLPQRRPTLFQEQWNMFFQLLLISLQSRSVTLYHEWRLGLVLPDIKLTDSFIF